MVAIHSKKSGVYWERKGIKVVELRGCPEEMGREHGRLLKDVIRHGYDNFIEKRVIPEIGGEIVGDDPLKISAFYDWCHAQALKYAGQIKPEYEEEYLAMARAADLLPDQGLLLQVVLDIMELAGLAHRDQFFHSCTQVAFLPELTGGPTLVARNLDWPPFGVAHTICTLFHFIPDNGIPFWSQGFAGMIGALTAINAEGLVITEESLTETKDVSDEGVPHCLLHREIVQYDSTLEAAKKRLAEAPRNNGYHTLITSAKENDALTVLTSAHHHAVRRSYGGACWGIEPDRTPEMFDEKALPHEDIPLTNDSSDIRYKRLRSLARELNREIGIKECVKWLADDFDTTTGKPGATLNSISNETTLQSFVADPANKKFYVAMGQIPAPAGQYVEFDLDETLT